MESRDPSAHPWDVEWMRAWKAHPDNVWFAYEAGVYLEQLGAPDPGRPRRVLKTDAFDEACGRRQLTAALGDDVVVVDVAPEVVRHAARMQGIGMTPCVADVRRLPFAPSSFDLILSTSTLDHFAARADIDLALGELRRILGDGGRLLLTLDNPVNPVLRLRRLVHGVTGAIAGLIPFRMGLTLSRRELVEAVERAGFAVSDSGYLVHAPRLLALWAGEWAARRRDVATGRRLGTLFRAIERGARRAPTRRWTAHFVFADCRPARVGAVVGSTAPVHRMPASVDPTAASVRQTPASVDDTNASHSGPELPRWLVGWKTTEQWLRQTYLRHVPPPVLARVDPPLRRVATAVRRVAAAPIYLRQALTPSRGACDGETGRVALWGAGALRSLLLEVLGEEWLHGESGDAPVHGIGAITARSTTLAAGCDLLIADTTPILAPLFRREGFHIVPGMVRFGGEPNALLAEIARRPKSLLADLARLRHADYRVEVWSHTAERSRLFYHRYLLPHAGTRFGAGAELPSFAHFDGLFAAGVAVAVVRPGAGEPDAIGLVVPRGAMLWCVVLGTRDADPAILRAGGTAGVYRAQIALAHAQGARLVDFGRCLPWATDGIYRYKWKWGLRPIPDGTQTLEWAVKVLRPDGAMARRLVERGVVVREGRRYRTFTADDLSAR